ncbi:hypothetical protein SSPSH_000477 [Salinisphaera shabanensis E1L3A]|uniref:DUF4174 domain-containing protein n=1 Tax=Salinisphaera shabanensis E1L3A TaxID=1033802 RepID=F7QA79_9GAMM|nr:DUF4174 domain-containing protein [Salinisphaera shabanensis]ERJ20367.1 hypothetical protein SSPSH_000477 [Salinisphaera shabanensis E1L3A]
MRKFLLASLFSTLIGAGSAGAATLDDLQWDYRVIAVFTPTDTAGEQAAGELSNTVGIAGRDIAWFVASPDAMHSNLSQPIERSSITALHDTGGFQAVLVGKDGGVKARQSESLDIKAFFDEIDSMPMRQQEMQQQ